MIYAIGLRSDPIFTYLYDIFLKFETVFIY